MTAGLAQVHPEIGLGRGLTSEVPKPSAAAGSRPSPPWLMWSKKREQEQRLSRLEEQVTALQLAVVAMLERLERAEHLSRRLPPPPPPPPTEGIPTRSFDAAPDSSDVTMVNEDEQTTPVYRALDLDRLKERARPQDDE